MMAVGVVDNWISLLAGFIVSEVTSEKGKRCCVESSGDMHRYLLWKGYSFFCI